MFAVQTVIDDEIEKVAEGAETEMTNADKFKHLFGIYATELWSMPEKDFLNWINSEVMNSSEIPNNSDTIYRQAAIDALESKKDKNAKGDIGGFYNKIIQNDIDELMQLPSVQPEECTETPACDCISRQAAIRIASGHCHPANIAAELAKLPPVQPEQRWIPVSERLPEEDYRYGENQQYSAYILMSAYNAEDRGTVVDYGHTIDGNWYSDTEHQFVPSGWEVIAWMPLPEPYKPHESEE